MLVVVASAAAFVAPCEVVSSPSDRSVAGASFAALVAAADAAVAVDNTGAAAQLAGGGP